MIPLRQISLPIPTPEPLHKSEAEAFLNHLRFMAMKCRAKPQTELFQACALLQVSRTENQVAHSEALVRCLSQALGKPFKFLAPGANEMTFDEQWVVQLGIACATGDGPSRDFLLRSRVALENQRLVAFLVGRIADYFSLN
ncbi:hypothetical protein IV417_03820 [Alphaproteobacteria bacterium KMM 3653]|uniref:Uncharacterized protein n=1 Tax=Harenicola maris TaxID=2841044 RepID=A0AAP2G747_9RHOB|nr:hypothetical protein [Harenicola maris]